MAAPTCVAPISVATASTLASSTRGTRQPRRDAGRPESGGRLCGGSGQLAEAGGLPGDDQRSTVGVNRHDIVEDAADLLRPVMATVPS